MGYSYEMINEKVDGFVLPDTLRTLYFQLTISNAKIFVMDKIISQNTYKINNNFLTNCGYRMIMQ